MGYPSDLSDAEWKIIRPLLPEPKSGGRPRTTDLRAIVNAIFYVLRSGCAWRMLPHDFPPYSTVYMYFKQWRVEGIWEKIHDVLRDRIRRREGRKKSPSAAIVDSQSVKTTEKGALAAMTRARR
jgi:putative transposase